jgi:hypothetical protein
MKRRYPQEIEAKRQEALSRFYGFDGNWSHTVYALVARESRRKTPFYVGETAYPRERFVSHLKVAYNGKEGSPKLARQLRLHIANGSLIEMHGLVGAVDRVDAHSLEAGWARALSRRGFSLANSWPEHAALSRQERIAETRLMALSLEEAQSLLADLSLVCLSCGATVPITYERLLEKGVGNLQLNRLQRSVRCAECDSPMTLRVDLPNEAQAKTIISEPSAQELDSFLQSIGRG